MTLAVRARGQEYGLLVATGDDPPELVAVVDGRTLDSVSAGGFLGLWIGVLATSNGVPTGSVATVDRLVYEPSV
nr:hypothetical protein GCM10025730_34940 [Promicromonospora thailandica]